MTDHIRLPLDQARPAQELPSLNGPWTAIGVVRQTGSTNADLLDLAARGLNDGLVLVAEEQTAGRGRQGRSWVSENHEAMTVLSLSMGRISRTLVCLRRTGRRCTNPA